MTRAVFLDRDGTLIEERNYLHRPEEVRVLPGAAAALRRLQDAGFRLFILTNQSGVGRGYFTLADIERVHERVLAEFGRAGVRFDRIYIAPEAPDQPSRGRKPSPQFLFDARDDFGVDLAQSYVIGDKLIDLECGWNAGVQQALLVRTGYGADLERQQPEALARAVVVDDLAAAAQWILSTLDGEAGTSKSPARSSRTPDGARASCPLLKDNLSQRLESAGGGTDVRPKQAGRPRAVPVAALPARRFRRFSGWLRLSNLPATP